MDLVNFLLGVLWGIVYVPLVQGKFVEHKPPKNEIGRFSSGTWGKSWRKQPWFLVAHSTSAADH